MTGLKSLATSKKIAIIISYISLVIHVISNLVLTPVYLHFLGMDQYGLYQMIYSVASYILILDFGIKTAMVRYISKYHAENDYNSERNFSAHCLITVISMIVLMITAGLILNVFILKIYKTITVEEADTAHQLLLLMLVVIAGTVLERFVSGCLASYEHFTVINLVSVAKLVLKIILSIVLLSCGYGVITLAVVDVLIIIFANLFLSIYAIKVIKFKIKLTKFEFSIIIELASFMLPVFLQAVIGYINNYVDKTVLGIMTTKSDVAIYSVAMTFITMFNSLPSAISGVFLPQATKLVYGGDCDSNKLTDFVIRPGRYQFMLCGGFVVGFALFGREFIYLWTGPNAVQAWLIALIIMIPNIVPLIQNTALSILDAMKKRLFRSVVLFLISIVNIIISVFLVAKYGMIGAPIGTALAFIFGYGVLMNIYYKKEIKIQVGRLFKSIFSKTWICLAIAGLIGVVFNFILTDYSWITLIIKGIVFIAVYGILLVVFGFNPQEKKDFSIILSKFSK